MNFKNGFLILFAILTLTKVSQAADLCSRHLEDSSAPMPAAFHNRIFELAMGLGDTFTSLVDAVRDLPSEAERRAEFQQQKKLENGTLDRSEAVHVTFNHRESNKILEKEGFLDADGRIKPEVLNFVRNAYRIDQNNKIRYRNPFLGTLALATEFKLQFGTPLPTSKSIDFRALSPAERLTTLKQLLWLNSPIKIRGANGQLLTGSIGMILGSPEFAHVYMADAKSVINGIQVDQIVSLEVE